MTTIISPISSMITTIVLVTIIITVLFRIQRGRFSDTSTLFRFSFLLLLATDTFATVSVMTYYFVYLPFLLGLVFGILTSAFFAAFCIGGIIPVDEKRAQDDIWRRWFKERNEWEEERKKRALTAEE